MVKMCTLVKYSVPELEGIRTWHGGPETGQAIREIAKRFPNATIHNVKRVRMQ